jgi:hypothetical protein
MFLPPIATFTFNRKEQQYDGSNEKILSFNRNMKKEWQLYMKVIFKVQNTKIGRNREPTKRLELSKNLCKETKNLDNNPNPNKRVFTTTITNTQ